MSGNLSHPRPLGKVVCSTAPPVFAFRYFGARQTPKGSIPRAVLAAQGYYTAKLVLKLSRTRVSPRLRKELLRHETPSFKILLPFVWEIVSTGREEDP